MKILMISSEGWPLARSGALADVLVALPRELKARGHEVALAMPYYREIRQNKKITTKPLRVSLEISLGEERLAADLLEGRTAEDLQIFFVRCDELFDRPGIYTEKGEPYEDNAARFIFFSKAAVEIARRMTPSPEILHCHDWTTALVPVLVRDQGLPFATVLSIHHLVDQGSFDSWDFALTNLPGRYFDLRGVEYFGRLNLLKGGILFADRIVVSSEPYVHQIQTPSLGEGLDIVLREHAHRLSGILGGADYRRWNPATDQFLPARYGPDKLERKTGARDALLAQLQLAPAPRGPVFGMVTRLIGAKGFDILMPVLDRLLADDVRLVILGKGDPAYETGLAIAARKYPERLAYRHDYDETLAHLIEGGSDIALIPSRVEPGAFSAMHSLKYGVLPIARATRGVEQIIADYDPSSDSGYGFLFYKYGSEPFWDAIKRAQELFEDQAEWRRLRKRAASLDFSWALAAQSYEALYGELTGQRSLVA
ncbi:MAG: glycogen synthase [Chthoniobacterales bacterium]|nr:glycogen synthase [Chthoniobacterales bacterium]